MSTSDYHPGTDGLVREPDVSRQADNSDPKLNHLAGIPDVPHKHTKSALQGSGSSGKVSEVIMKFKDSWNLFVPFGPHLCRK